MKQTKKDMEIIKALMDNYEEDFLCIGSYLFAGEFYSIGIFKCKVCSKPILHPQYHWSGLCPACDLGKESPKWKIEKPSEDGITTHQRLGKLYKELITANRIVRNEIKYLRSVKKKQGKLSKRRKTRLHKLQGKAYVLSGFILTLEKEFGYKFNKGSYLDVLKKNVK